MTIPTLPRNFSSSTSRAFSKHPEFRVLVVIPTLGERLRTLETALSSVRDQAGVIVDVLVVTKNTSKALESLAAQNGVEVMQHSGHISSALNAGFARAGEGHRYLSWIGDDDMLRSGALWNASAILERHPKAVVCFGDCDYIDVDGNLLFRRRPPPMAPFLLQLIPGLVKQEACLFRRTAVEQVGGLDETLRYTMDLDLLLKLRRMGDFARIRQNLAAFRWHAASLTIANRRMSLAEAQRVQRRHARGPVAWILKVFAMPLRFLIQAASDRICQRSGFGRK